MNDQIGALDDSHTEGFFGLADETLSADCGTDAYLVDITGFESDIDNQTWWDLSAIFSQGF
ncbi:hypothetical protein TGAMA5MH_01960 [Trichoderma gamsii]|uniref:Uncharacterized protein n=1 Tax=Trichoderma gamsii TaxID=398673 RepID=A0A2K0TLW0_9HYPO|nr:hypothetical protein TGAMA5MH_01960 [Trichoderma gamsii]